MIKHISSLVNSLPSSYAAQPNNTQPVVSKPESSPISPLQNAFAKQVKLKKTEDGVLAVISYFIKFGFAEGCFIKQENFARQLKKFGYKPIRRQQVGIICRTLLEKGLVTRIRRHRRAPYEYLLTNLGEAYYLIKNPAYQKQAEPRRDDWADDKKPYIEKDKNRTSQSKILFNKSSYKNSWGKDMKNTDGQCNGPRVKTQAQLDRDKINELKATEMAKEALAREGLQDPYKNAQNGLQVDYETARNYNSKLSSYTCYYRNQLSAN